MYCPLSRAPKVVYVQRHNFRRFTRGFLLLAGDRSLVELPFSQRQPPITEIGGGLSYTRQYIGSKSRVPRAGEPPVRNSLL